MKKLVIKNREEIAGWMAKYEQSGCDIKNIQGPAPEGSVYDDGVPIVHPVNVAFIEPISGDRINIEYE